MTLPERDYSLTEPELRAELANLRSDIRALGASWGENSLFATGAAASALENCARELAALADRVE